MQMYSVCNMNSESEWVKKRKKRKKKEKLS